MNGNHENYLIWLQRDALGPLNPAIVRYPDASRVFAFDAAWMDEEQPSEKRIRFIEECLAAIAAQAVHGSAVSAILEQCRTSGAQKVVTTTTSCRHARAAMESLCQSIPVDVLELPGLVRDPGPFDLGSFSRFWAKASKTAF